MDFSLPCETTESIDSLNIFYEMIQERSILEMESLSPEEIRDLIKQSKLANLLVPSDLGGQGLSLSEGLNVIRKVAEKSPSTSIMLCMHYHVVSTLIQFMDYIPSGFEIISDVAQNNALVASAFSEAVPGQDIFTSSVKAMTLDSEVKIHGTKKPCTMSSVADYYAVSVTDHENPQIAGIALVRKELEGIEVKEFWPDSFLRAADSNEVFFNNVKVSSTDIILAPVDQLSDLLGFGMASFTFSICAAYTGIANTLANKLPTSVKTDAPTYVDIYGELLQIHYGVQGLIPIFERTINDSENPEQLINAILILRYQTQSSTKSIVAKINEHIGGMKYVFDKEVRLLSSLANLLSFHPVNRCQFIQQLQIDMNKEATE